MGLLFPKVCDESRKVHLDQSDNIFCNNKVDTTKYNLLTFLPKSLLFQFFRLSNVVFLVNTILQSVPIISSLSPITAVGPLAFVLGVSMLREGYEDYKRHKKDWEINSRTTRILRHGVFVEAEWDEVKVGDYVKILSGEIIPADILLLYSSEENSICYVETSNLDGENNLKEKFAFTQTIKVYPHEFQSLKGHCLVDAPKSNLYDFEGEIKVQNGDTHYIGYHNLVLRETVLKNTDQVVGVALYCGYDTKILKNQGQVHHKVSQVETKLNYIQAGLVILLLALCATCSFGYYIIHSNYGLRKPNSYIPAVSVSPQVEAGIMFFTIFLLLNFLIPITLNILIEGIKTFSGIFLSFDRKMYDKEIDKYCGILNTSIIQELGVVDCVLTDKTGTLTANEMVFKTIAIRDRVYTREFIEENLEYLVTERHFDDFWVGLIICHDVVKDQMKEEYQGSSPDEVCFINFANSIGYTFVKRTKNYIQVRVQNEKRVYELVDVIPFSSRKRMSVIVRNTMRQNEVIVYTKGADTAIFDNSLPYEFGEQMNINLNIFAKEGLRTLVFAKRIISKDAFNLLVEKRAWIKNRLRQRIITKEEASSQENQVIEEIQSKLVIIGSTGIEDKLQEDVPETISRLQRAGIRVMMITGDKLETAENIGYLAHLIEEDYFVVKLSTDTTDIRAEAIKIIQDIDKNHRDISVIIEGRQINKILEENDQFYIDLYSKILSKAKSVIFCRSSPKEKALIVGFVKKNMKSVVLAIGDGGNDVGMIQQAHIGVGIIGKEGNSASVVSDFSFGKFKFLDRLILHHGRWYYYRLSYFFVFFGWKNIIITLVIYFFLIESGFSGTFNYTDLCYVLYNSFFAVSLLVNFGLYDQDINDDLQPKIWKYLPEIYKQTKLKELFSYRRYIIWVVVGVVMSVMMYFIIRLSLSPLEACDENGMIPDLKSARLANGMTLMMVILLVNYIDTKTHTYFFQFFVLGIMTIVPTVGYFLAENYMQMLNFYFSYSDNFNLRFWLAIFMVIAITFLAKIGFSSYYFEYEPTIIDSYLRAKQQGCKDIDGALREAIEYGKKQKDLRIHPEIQFNSSKLEEVKESAICCNRKESVSSNEEMVMKRFMTSFDSTTQEMGNSKQGKDNYKSAMVNIHKEEFD